MSINAIKTELMRTLLILVLIFLTINISGKTITSRVNDVEKEIKILQVENNSLEKQIEELKSTTIKQAELLETQLNLISNSNGSISNQISSSTNLISIAGLIFALFALFIGIYVTWIQSRSSKILEKSKDILTEIKKSKEDVVNTQKLIDNDLKGLYHKIQEQEVEYILSRLEKIPEDIQHVFHILASFEIPEKFYDRIKPMIIEENVKENKNDDYIESLLAIACQHFPALVVKDEQLMNVIFNLKQNLFLRFYEIETDELIVKFVNQVEKDGLNKSNDKINKYLLLIEKLNYCSRSAETVFNTLTSKHSRFEFARIIKSFKEINKFQKAYNTLLVETYKDDNNSENDRLLLAEL